MPPYVLQNKAIVPFIIDTNHHQLYYDRLCFFRCMAAHQTGARRCVEARTRALFRQWTDTSVDEFDGINLWELDELEVAHAFGCEKCGKQYKERKKLIWHEKRCAGDEIKRYYAGGVYHPNPTPLEVLADEGVPVETDFV
ncbi:hypothetical protein PoB_004574700 [Plakobranchus ocellatus]|uniref:C2H2-type domain-containing protein n=1 Tax=Plakobranchus ocellatus TaxID=259542 RepID=A0AAV4BIM3_9GAST|nr:hypothetical protein PoB_004574700 [Plakobranchus ocellatus]